MKRSFAAITVFCGVAVPALAQERASSPTVDPCTVLIKEVIGRLGPNVSPGSCVTDAQPGHWTDASADATARVGVPSWFTLTGPGRAARVRATVEVDGTHARVVSTQTRGSLLTSDDVRTERGSLTGARLTRLVTADDLAGARLLRTIDADAVIGALDVALAPVIKAGEQVVAFVRIGGVEVTATMTAVDPGRIGDHIRIAHKDRKRVLNARVVAAGRVEVAYER